MRKPTPEEAPYAEFVIDFEGAGTLFCNTASVLTRTYVIGGILFEVKNPQYLRRTLKQFREWAKDRVLIALFDDLEKNLAARLRFAKFFGFKEGGMAQGLFYMYRAPKPYT